jgi:hypothetical protein
MQESQRLYSVAPLVLRKALQDVRIGPYTIPKGTAILIHIFAMHNTSRNYERHTEFLPVCAPLPVFDECMQALITAFHPDAKSP